MVRCNAGAYSNSIARPETVSNAESPDPSWTTRKLRGLRLEASDVSVRRRSSPWGAERHAHVGIRRTEADRVGRFESAPRIRPACPSRDRTDPSVVEVDKQVFDQSVARPREPISRLSRRPSRASKARWRSRRPSSMVAVNLSNAALPSPIVAGRFHVVRRAARRGCVPGILES